MVRSRYTSTLAQLLAVSVLLSVWGLFGAATALADDEVVAADGTATKNGPDVDCSGTDAAEYTSVDDAVDGAVAGDVVYICAGTYGPDENITITKNVELQAVGGTVTIRSEAGNAQAPAIAIRESGPEIDKVEVKGGTSTITIEHTTNGGNDNATTIDVANGIAGVELKNLMIDRGSSLQSTSAAIKGNDTGITVSQTEIRGGPIGFYGASSGDYTITNTTIEGAGDEGIWVVYANTLTLRNNTIKTTDDGSAPNDRLGIAVYDVETRLTFENNTIQATEAPLVLGDDLPVTAGGQSFTLSTVEDMRALLGANTLNGGSPAKITFPAQQGGTLRGEADDKGNNDKIHVIRTGLTNIAENGGAVPYDQSAIEGAKSGDVLQLTGGTTYSETVRLTSSPTGPAQVDKNLSFAAPTPTTLEKLLMDGAYTVGVPSGSLTISANLTLGDGSTLSGAPIVLGDGATVTDNGLSSGSIQATRTVSDGEKVTFGGIGLTLAENGGLNAPGKTTVTRTDGDPVTKGAGSIERYYDVSAENDNVEVTLTFEYDDDELNGISESALALFRSDDQGGSWAQIGTASTDEQNNTLTNESLSSFSRFTAAADGATLPVELARFEATTDGGAVQLRWTTASETNNAGFDVQRKTEDGFETVTFVDGAGTTTQSTTYTHRVRDLDHGTHTFRLQQVDQDGTTHHSDPVSVTLGLEGEYEVSRVAPNPVATRSRVEVAVQRTQDVTVALYDALGRRVTTLHTGTMASKTTHRLGVDTRGLSSGTYFLRVRGEAFRITRRVVVVR